MAWIAATLIVDATYVESLADALLETGATSVDVTDAEAGTPQEHAMFAEPGEPPAGEWQRSRLSALFAPADDIASRVAAALNAVGLDAATLVEYLEVADQDWVRETQSQFQPVRV